jgi:hypothetical protein
MDGYIFVILIAILIILIVCRANTEDATFTNVSPVPNYPISYIQGVRIGRKIFDPTYHDPALYRTPKQYLGPI